MTNNEETEYFAELNKAAEAALSGDVVEIPKDIETSEDFIKWVRSED
jgi:hypothetical protein